MNNKSLFILLLLFIPFANFAQEITYDTTYKVTYNNGIKDSVIIIYKRVVITEKVYLVDSSNTIGFGYDIFSTPYFTGATRRSTTYTSENFSNNNQANGYNGQELGGHIYCNLNKWELRTGISIARHSIKASGNQITRQTITKSTFVNDTLDVYFSIDENGDTSFFSIVEPKMIFYEEDENREIKNKSKINLYYLRIPIQLGYKTEYKGLNINFYAGPVISILIFSTGDVLDERGVLSGQAHSHAERAILQMESNVQVSYTLKGKFQLFGEPFIQKYIGTFNQSKTVYSSDIIGLRAGIKFSL